MITLRFKDDDRLIGTISDEELEFLVDELEEENDHDVEYYVDTDTIDMLEDDGAPETLTTLLRKALGEEDGIEVVWTRS